MIFSLILIMCCTFNTTNPHFKKEFGYGWPHPDVSRPFENLLISKNPANSFNRLNIFKKVVIFEILMTPGLERFQRIKDQRAQKNLGKLISFLKSDAIKYHGSSDPFMIEAISRTWDGAFQYIRPLFLKQASNEQFWEGIRIWYLKYSKTLTLKQLTQLYQEAKKRKMVIRYDIIGDQQIPFDKFRIDYLYLGISPQKILKIPVRKRIFYRLEGVQDYEKMIILLKDHLNQPVPGKKELVLDQLIRLTNTLIPEDPERHHIKILQKHGAKTYKELQTSKNTP